MIAIAKMINVVAAKMTLKRMILYHLLETFQVYKLRLSNPLGPYQKLRGL